MNTYELTVLVRNEADVNTVKQLLESFEASVKKEEKWGKRDLAYPIGKDTSAFYFTYTLEIDGTRIEDFKQKMNFEEKVMRYLMLKVS